MSVVASFPRPLVFTASRPAKTPKKLLTLDHIFHMQRAVLLTEAILFPYFSHNAPVYMGFISCDIMVMHFNNLSFIAVSSQLFRSGVGMGGRWAGRVEVNICHARKTSWKLEKFRTQSEVGQAHRSIQSNKKPKRNIKHPPRVKEQ